jgi:hypothetical protein
MSDFLQQHEAGVQASLVAALGGKLTLEDPDQLKTL